MVAAVALAAAQALCAVPAGHVISGVPFVKQEPQWCGPAALASVLQYWGVAATQEEIAREIALPDGRVLNLDLKLYARRKGLRADSCRGTCKRLRLWVSRDVPIICQIRTGGPGARTNHFVVVYGCDEDQACFIAHTGARAGQELGYLDFSRAWQEAERWLLVVRARPKE